MNAVEEIREALLLQIHHEIETRDEVEFGLEVQIQCVHFDWVELVSHQSIAEICFDKAKVCLVDVDRVELYVFETVCSEKYFGHQPTRDTGHHKPGLQQRANDVTQQKLLFSPDFSEPINEILFHRSQTFELQFSFGWSHIRWK